MTDFDRHGEDCRFPDDACPCTVPLFEHRALIAAARCPDEGPTDDRLDAADVVANQREAFMSSPTLDRSWIAGWHAAIDHATYKVRATLAEYAPTEGPVR